MVNAYPQTALHYTPNSNFTADGSTYLPGGDGFNLADISSPWYLDHMPSGVKAMAWLGLGNGADASFQSTVSRFMYNPHLYGFYLVDEPDPTGQYGPLVTAANLKAESDWIHAHVPGAKTFIVLMNMGTPTNPSYANTYNSPNTHVDYFGLDPYPVRPQFSGGINLNVINAAMSAAESAGIAARQVVPVYQAFGGGGYSSYGVPTASQEQQILSTWGSLVPNPPFDFAYSWGQQNNDSSLAHLPALQDVVSEHNKAATPAVSDSTMTATDSNGVTVKVPVIMSGTQETTGPLAGAIHQSVSSGIDTIAAVTSITSEKLSFGSSTPQINFIGSQLRTIYGGLNIDIVTATAGANTFVAGAGMLDAKGGSGKDSYVFHAGDGLLRIEDFSLNKGDSLTVDKALQSTLSGARDGHGGFLLTLGPAGHGIDLVGYSSFSASNIHWI